MIEIMQQEKVKRKIFMEKLKSNKNPLKFFRWMSLFTIMLMVILYSGKIVNADSVMSK